MPVAAMPESNVIPFPSGTINSIADAFKFSDELQPMELTRTARLTLACAMDAGTSDEAATRSLAVSFTCLARVLAELGWL